MDRIAAFWELAGTLTYGELVEIGQCLHDTQDVLGVEVSTARDWAELIDAAREAAQTVEEEPA
jgi:hypothetical protein